MFVGKKEEFTNTPSWVSSDFIIARTFTAEKESGTVINGRNIVKAGTPYEVGAVVIGIVLDDVDVTENAQPVGIMVEGYVYGARLPEATLLAVADLAKITVEEYNETEGA